VSQVLIELRDLSVRRADRPVLDGASLTLSVGDRLALVGANGAGKTTLLRAIVGLEPIVAGEVVAFGEPRRVEADFRPVRQRVGFLLQDANDQLFCPTVLEDVAFGPLNLGFSPAQATERAGAVLDDLGLGQLASRLTHRLSGGEQRLVALAGVLAMDPDVLLLDEPTNALDEHHLARLIEILNDLPVAMIVVSHDAHFLAEVTQRALLLEHGRLTPAVAHRHRHQHDHVHFHPLDEA
jgi:cobalt/nickel transport system ATP-binding protein